jgi:hypothetical protein
MTSSQLKHSTRQGSNCSTTETTPMDFTIDGKLCKNIFFSYSFFSFGLIAHDYVKIGIYFKNSAINYSYLIQLSSKTLGSLSTISYNYPDPIS